MVLTSTGGVHLCGRDQLQAYMRAGCFSARVFQLSLVLPSSRLDFAYLPGSCVRSFENQPHNLQNVTFTTCSLPKQITRPALI